MHPCPPNPFAGSCGPPRCERPLPSTPLSTSELGLVTENLHDQVGSVNRRAEYINRMTIFSWDKTVLASGVVLALAIETQVLGEELVQKHLELLQLERTHCPRVLLQIPRSVVLTGLSMRGMRPLSFTREAIGTHCSRIGSTPVGLWAERLH